MEYYKKAEVIQICLCKRGEECKNTEQCEHSHRSSLHRRFIAANENNNTADNNANTSNGDSMKVVNIHSHITS